MQVAKKKDTLVFLGDLVGKGQDSPRVLRLARELGALAVRGNHDDAALAAYDFSRKHGGALPKLSSSGSDTGGEDFSFVRNLTERDARFLRKMPWTLEVPALAAVAVHAGLVPGVAVDEQRPSDSFTMRGVVEVEEGENDGGDGDDSFIVRGWRWLLRSLFHKSSTRQDEHGSKVELGTGRRGGGKAPRKKEKKEEKKVSYRATAAIGEGKPWARVWSSFPGQSKHAVFGHDTRAGLQLEKWATGLDSGCVTGGELTALVVPIPTSTSSSSHSSSSTDEEESQNRLPNEQQQPRGGRWPAEGVELVSVKCRGGARKGERH